MNFNYIKMVFIAATAMISLNAFSQDLIARQAPIDRKLKSVDSLALQRQIRIEQSAYSGLSTYPNWNNEHVLRSLYFHWRRVISLKVWNVMFPDKVRL